MRASIPINIPDAAIRKIVAEENQKLLLKIEEIFMSILKPLITDLTGQVNALTQALADERASNKTLTEQAVLKDEQLALKDEQLAAKDKKIEEAEAKLVDALANTVDPEEVKLLQDLLQVIADALNE